MVQVPRTPGAPVVRVPGAPAAATPVALAAPPTALPTALAAAAARRLAALRAGGPGNAPLHPLHDAHTCFTCVDVARRTGRRERGKSTRASGHRPVGTFPPGGTPVTRCQATLFAPRAPPMTV